MRVLIVDDSITIRTLLKTLYKRKGMDVSEASSGEEAIEYFQLQKYDLITMDIELKGMNGYETSKKIREFEVEHYHNSKPTPILFISQNDSLEGRIRGFESGASDFITKPFTIKEIDSLTSKLLNPKNTFEGSTILLAEDSEVTRTIISRSIREEGGTVIEAKNGKIALEIYRESPDKFDLLVTDLYMPEMDGIQLCETLRYTMGIKDLPIIFLTAASELNLLIKIFKTGANDYILKPFSREEVLARIKAHLNNHFLHQQLVDKLKELKKLNKIKDDFLRASSHDLSTPLNSINGFLQLLEMNLPVSSENETFLKQIYNSTNTLRIMIQDLLDITNIHFEDNLELIGINIIETIQNFLPTAKVLSENKQIHFSSSFPHGSNIMIKGNELAIKRIFNNIISNSIKYTSRNGKIDLNLYLSSSGDEITIQIIDSGIGIPPEKIDQILNQNNQVSSSTGTMGEKGNGIGLSISRKLIEKQGGRLEIIGDPGKGSEFKVIFPIFSP
ncbi:MAG: response regulator [Leptospiraceae bacterium]|nr:response regulator [Leptospiraceae bacterium]MCP5512050.1 response regulator [Leptospiraceae bacterium]